MKKKPAYAEREGTFLSSFITFLLCIAVIMAGIVGFGLGCAHRTGRCYDHPDALWWDMRSSADWQKIDLDERGNRENFVF